MKIHKIDHVGIIVNNLTAVKEFFIEFGLEVIGEGEVDGKWAERITGFTDVKATIVILGMSDGQANLEFGQVSYRLRDRKYTAIFKKSYCLCC